MLKEYSEAKRRNRRIKKATDPIIMLRPGDIVRLHGSDTEYRFVEFEDDATVLMDLTRGIPILPLVDVLREAMRKVERNGEVVWCEREI